MSSPPLLRAIVVPMLDLLPADVLAGVLEFLPEARDKVALASTCAHCWGSDWRHQGMTVRLASQGHTAAFTRFLKSGDLRIPKLSLYALVPGVDPEPDGMNYIGAEDTWDFQALVSQLPELRHLVDLDLHTNIELHVKFDFFGMMPTSLHTLDVDLECDMDFNLDPLVKCTALTHFRLGNKHSLNSWYPYRRGAGGLPTSLVSLHILGACMSYQGVFEEAGKLPNLRVLGMGHNAYMEEDAVEFVDGAMVYGNIYKCIRESLDVSTSLKTYTGYPAFDWVPTCLEHVVIIYNCIADDGEKREPRDDLQAQVSTCRPGLQTNNLRTVRISGYEMRQMSHHLAKLHMVESLDFTDNDITIIHESIGQLPHLRHLSLSNNRLKRLPRGLDALTQLTVLDLTDNPDLPASAIPSALRARCTVMV